MPTLYSILTSVIAFIIIGFIAASCAVVKTAPSTQNVSDAHVYYYLPESMVKIHAVTKVKFKYNLTTKLISQKRIIEQSFSASSEMIADTRELLTLSYKPNALMADDIKFVVNEKGLLESADITTEDRLPNIIEALSQAPASIAGASLAGAAKASDEVEVVKEFSADFVKRARDIGSKDISLAWVINGTLDQEGNPVFSIDASFSIATVTVAAPAQGQNGSNAPAVVNSSDKSFDGLLTRPLMNLDLQIKPAADLQVNPLVQYLIIADVNKLIRVPIKRTAFVKRVNKITLSNGIITSNQIIKPSSVEGLVSIPVNVAKMVVSIPAEIIQVKINTAKNKEALEKQVLALQQSVTASEKYVYTKQKELEEVKLELEKAKTENKTAIEILQLTTQKDLLKAQADLIRMQKELDDLKKQVADQN